MTAKIQEEYSRLGAKALEAGGTPHFQNMTRLFAQQELWRGYQGLLDLVPRTVAGCDVVDIGCKYGHVMPLLFAQGARSVTGVDVIDEYLSVGANALGAIYPNARFVKSEQGYLPIEGDTIDLVIVNEVISHVNPGFLPIMYSEIARILRVDGYVLISDGNNVANEECRKDLINVYDAWENGPAGRKTGRDIVDDSFVDLRRRLIHSWYPDLPVDRVEYAAANTSGLHGDYLRTIIDRLVSGHEFVARPYRHGDCPTNPTDGGCVMEFGFFPQQVEMALAAYGIRATQLLPAPRLSYGTFRQLVGSAYVVGRHYLSRMLRPDRERGASWGFQILGVKER